MSDSTYRVGIDGDASGIRDAAKKGKAALQSVDDQAKATNATVGEGTANAASQAGAALGAAGATGARGMADIGAAANLATQGLQLAMKAAQGLTDAIGEAAKRSSKMAGMFIEDRDKLRELANVMEVKADSKFTLENQQFNVDAAMTSQEGLAFRLQFQNSAAQFKGSKIDAGEYAEYEKQAAQLMASRGLADGNSGDFSGSILGFKDRKNLGKNASEDALGKVSSSLSILGRGKGDNPVLIRQMSMLGSAALNEDEMKGIFQDSDEVATVISVAAEKHDAQAAEMARAAIRAIRDPDKKIQELRDKAKITSKTSFIESMRRIAPIIQQQAEDQGIKTEDALAQTFPGILERDAIGVFLNKGVAGGLFDDREAWAKSHQGSEKPLKDIQEFQTDPTQGGGDRVAQAKLKFAELDRAAKDAIVERFRTQAQTEMEAEGKGSTGDNIGRFFEKVVTGGLVDIDRGRETAKMEDILERRAKAAGLPYRMRNQEDNSQEAINQWMRDRSQQIQGAGGNPYADTAPLVNAVKDMHGTMTEIHGTLKSGANSISLPLNGPPPAWNPRP